MDIITREAKIEDLETLYKIELECFGSEAFTKTQLGYFLKSSGFVSLVAEVDGFPAGFIIGAVEQYKNKIFGHIYSLDVSQEYRRKGVASRLLDKLERIFVRNKAEVCYLEVRVDNAAATELYKKHGYRVTETLKKYYPMGINGFRLKKDLSLGGSKTQKPGSRHR